MLPKTLFVIPNPWSFSSIPFGYYYTILDLIPSLFFPRALLTYQRQIIYVGDGASDAPCFAVVNQGGGIGIGLYKESQKDKWSQQDKISANQRVANIAPPDYSENSELMQSLVLAIEGICKQIALRKLSVGE